MIWTKHLRLALPMRVAQPSVPPRGGKVPYIRYVPLKSRFLRQLVFQVILLVLAGCSQQHLVQKFASQAEQDLARHYFDLLRQKRLEDIEPVIDSSIRGPSLHDTLGKMAALIPAGEPTSVTLVGVNRMNMAGATTTLNLTFEYDFSGKWLTMNVAVKRQGGNSSIVGFNVNPESTSLEQQNKFTLGRRTSVQYIVFALTIALPLLTIWSLVVCVRTKLKGRKWPWVLFILFGIGKFAVNWTTGDWAFTPLSIQLFSAAAAAPLYGPRTLAISIPLGAVMFLLRRSETFSVED
jgi:hypothetical protein